MPAPALNSPPLTERAVTSGAKRLLAEWLLHWFDGTDKALGAGAVSAWPSLTADRLYFDQDWPKPLDGVDLRVIVMQTGGTRGVSSGAGEVATERLAIQIHVRAGGKIPPALGKNDADAMQRVTDDLKAICNNPDSLGQLAMKGLTLVSCRGPNPIQTEGPKLALLTLAAETDFEIA